MAPTTYEPEFQKFASPASNSPISGSGTPVSFRANVNRTKTKRWVEAKQVSYDGDDWGDDDEDDYEEEPPPVPPTHFSQRTGNTAGLPRPAFPAMDRSRSMDHVLTVDPDGASGSRSRSVEAAAAGQPADSRPAPFVRPADIYKRLREDRTRDGMPVATRSNTAPIESFPTVAAQGQEMKDKEPTNVAVKNSQDVPVIGLPDVKRLSGLNTDFLSGSENKNSNTREVQCGEPQQHQLQHNPSLGFRSAVNQAFDVPETPSSTDDSVARSNSASTSAISPIIPSRGLNDEKTPTIVEEPGEMTPKDTSDRNPIFKPGHRRDLSVPSPDNSPSRKPKIMDNDRIPQSAMAQLSYTTPSESLEDQTLPSLRQPKRTSVQLPATSGKDLPPPLRVSSNQSNVPAASNNSDPPAVIVPSISADNSPQDTESDRLRKEIIRSLSRENTPSDEPELGSRPQTRGGDSLVPSEYERYWNEEANRSPQEQPNPMPDYNSPSTASPGVGLNDTPVGPALAPWQEGSKPKLKKKFSWESSEEEAEAAANSHDQTMQDPPIPGQLPPEPDSPPMITLEPNRQSLTEKPKLSIIPPSAGDESSIISGRYLPEVVPEPMEPDAAPENEAPQLPVPAFAAPNTMPSVPSTVLGFRDILGIKSSDERVRQFERTRAQFGAIDTGLNHWIQVTIQAHPEHSDIVGQNLKLSAGAQKQLGRKFPKLPSLGKLPHAEGAPTGAGHARRPSAPLGAMMNKQQVEQRGKDLLHTAGFLGGQAGKAAKGFFNRGRSKFKGNEKVDA